MMLKESRQCLHAVVYDDAGRIQISNGASIIVYSFAAHCHKHIRIHHLNGVFPSTSINIYILVLVS